MRSVLISSGCPIIFTLEGGYDLESLAESAGITVEEMLKARLSLSAGRKLRVRQTSSRTTLTISSSE